MRNIDDNPNEEMVKLVLKYNTKQSPYLLDIGCFDGSLVEKFRELGFNAFGLDISDKLFDKDYAEKGYLIRGNGSEIKEIFKEQKFDFIVSTRLLCKQDLNKTIDTFLDLVILSASDRIDFQRYQKETAHEIYKQIYAHLNDGGYSIHLNDEYEEIIAFPENGFKIVEQNPNLLVLHKYIDKINPNEKNQKLSGK